MRELVAVLMFTLAVVAPASAQPAGPPGLRGRTPAPTCDAAELRDAWADWKRVGRVPPRDPQSASDPVYAQRRAALARYETAHRWCQPKDEAKK